MQWNFRDFSAITIRDGPKTFWVETETKTETWAPETETGPRRSPNCPRRDRDETLECPRRDRDETFFWSRLYRDTWLIYMHGICTSHCVPKKESLRLGWKKQVNNKQSLILQIPKTFMFLFKWCVLQCFTQIPYCHYNLKTGRYKHRSKLSRPRPRPRP